MSEAAWYPDPSGSGHLRYWDGSQWTEHVAQQNTDVIPTMVAAPSKGLPAVAILAIALVGVLMVGVMVAVAIPTFLGARDRAERRLAAAEVAGVCAPYLEMSRQADKGVAPTHDQLTAIVNPMVGPFQQAAAKDKFFVPGRDAVLKLDAVLNRAPGAPSPATPKEVEQAANTIALACSSR